MRKISVNGSRIEFRFDFDLGLKDRLKSAFASFPARFEKPDSGEAFWWIKLSPKSVQESVKFGERESFDGVDDLLSLDKSKLAETEVAEKIETQEKIDQAQKLQNTLESVSQMNQELRDKLSFALTLMDESQITEYRKYLNGEIVDVVEEKSVVETKEVHRFIDAFDYEDF